MQLTPGFLASARDTAILDGQALVLQVSGVGLDVAERVLLLTGGVHAANPVDTVRVVAAIDSAWVLRTNGDAWPARVRRLETFAPTREYPIALRSGAGWPVIRPESVRVLVRVQGVRGIAATSVLLQRVVQLEFVAID